MIPKTLFFLVCLNGVTLCRQDTTSIELLNNDKELDTDLGYIIVECDSSGIDIFIDNMLVGQYPINNPVPMTVGKHVVTYLRPEYLSLLKQYYSKKELKKYLEKGTKTVYVIPGETIKVKLWWKPYEKALVRRKTQHHIKSGIGILLISVLLLLSAQLTN